MCCFNFLGRFTAFLLGIIFVMVMCGSLWGFNVNRTAYNAQVYEETFQDEDIYRAMSPIALLVLAETAFAQDENPLPGNIQFDIASQNLSFEEQTEISTEILPPEYLQAQIEDNLTVFIEYLNLERNRLDIRFQTGLVIDNLAGQGGERLVNRIFTSWDTCTPEQDLELEAYFAGTGENIPYCRSSNVDLQRRTFTTLSEAKDELVTRLQTEAPEEWVLRDQLAQEQGITLEEVDRQLYDQIQVSAVQGRDLFPLLFLIPGFFLAVIIILTVRSAKGFFRWMGWPLALAGLGALLPLFLLAPALLALVDASAGGVDAEVSEALINVLRRLVVAFTRPILVQAGIITVVGFLFILISILMPDPEEAYQLALAEQRNAAAQKWKNEQSAGSNDEDNSGRRWEDRWQERRQNREQQKAARSAPPATPPTPIRKKITPTIIEDED